MTIREVITEYGSLRKQPLPTQTLLKIISNTEARICREILAPQGEAPFAGYTEADLGKELIAPAPYDMIYVWACCYKHDLRENQTTNAANSREMTEDIFQKLAAYWMRSHQPKEARFSDPCRNV